MVAPEVAEEIARAEWTIVSGQKAEKGARRVYEKDMYSYGAINCISQMSATFI